MPSPDIANGVAGGDDLRAETNVDLTPSARFRLPSTRTYAQQYAHIYFCRLTQLRQKVRAAAEAQFGPWSKAVRYAASLVEASSDEDIDTVIVGVVFRQMATKPSILALYDQPSPHRLIPDPPPRATAPYPSPTDTVYLEDDNARCTLDLSSLKHGRENFVTGIVLAVRGREHRPTGAFTVSDVALATPAPQPPLPSPPKPGRGRQICIVSGLLPHAGSPALALLQDALQGGVDGSDRDFAQSTSLLVVAGNVVPESKPPAPSQEAVPVTEAMREAQPLNEADRMLTQLSSALPVLLLPGANDPVNLHIPQQEFHRCLFPGASRNKTLLRTSNPTCAKLDGRQLLVASGQNLDDLALYDAPTKMEVEDEENGKEDKSNMKDVDARTSGSRAVELMELMLNNRHIAPTCPDTLASFPFVKEDPFVLDETPHVFAVGNQKEFATKLMRCKAGSDQEREDAMEDGEHGTSSVRLVSVPRFDETGQAVFVDLDTLECSVREFATTL